MLARWIAATATMALLSTLAAAPSFAAKVETSYKQPSCNALKAKSKSEKASSKARRLAKFQYTQCTADRKVYTQVRDSYFLGQRTDGVEVDAQYCSNGKAQGDVARNGEVYKKGWRVVSAKFKKNGKDFTAVVEVLTAVNSRQISKFVQAFEKTGSEWKVGYADRNNEPVNAGLVTRTSAKAACSKL